MKKYKHLLDRLGHKIAKVSPSEAMIIIRVHNEIEEKYFCNDISYKEIYHMIAHELDYMLSDSDEYKRFYWKLKTLNDLYANKCGVIGG